MDATPKPGADDLGLKEKGQSILKGGGPKPKGKSPAAQTKKQIRFAVEYDGGGVEKPAPAQEPGRAGRAASVADRSARARGRQSMGQKGSQARAGGAGASPQAKSQNSTRVKDRRARQQEDAQALQAKAKREKGLAN